MPPNIEELTADCTSYLEMLQKDRLAILKRCRELSSAEYIIAANEGKKLSHYEASSTGRGDYRAFVLTTPDIELIDKKIAIVERMQAALTDGIDGIDANQKRLGKMASILTPENREILSTHRNRTVDSNFLGSIFAAILKAFGHQTTGKNLADQAERAATAAKTDEEEGYAKTHSSGMR